ncbi:MAG: hypothetical protein RLZ92_1523, partial [Pseudomonadota bacterium]
MLKNNSNNRQKSKSVSTRLSSLAYALEPRILFDGAAVATADATVSGDNFQDSPNDNSALNQQTEAVLQALSNIDKQQVTTAITSDNSKQLATTDSPTIFITNIADPALDTAITDAQQRIVDFINNTDDKTLFELFNGGKSAADDNWNQHLSDLRIAINQGDFKLTIVEMDSASQFTSLAAYTHAGPNGEPTVFINRYWFDLFAGYDSTRALVEEFGHAMDDYLNPNTDTSGDEGESFAAKVMADIYGATTDSSLQQNDAGQVTVNAVDYQVEFASFNFANAYAMVYDLNNNNAINGNLGETAAEKEQSSHNFSTTGLGAATVSDNTNNRQFSGNDVSAATTIIGGQTYYGWISRPIKSGGVVRGFYFWTDNDFTNLATAQADGNSDGDNNTNDNKGFLLVVDQAWFTSQISAQNTTITLNNNFDGLNRGSVTYSTVGSSSDRVDSALNGLITANVAPTATADTADGNNGTTAAVESGWTWSSGSNTTVTGTNAAGNVLTNDTDANSDTLTVTKVGTSSATQTTITSGTTSSNGTSVIGKYGTLTLGANGSYSYAVNNSNTTVNALQVNSTLSDVFTYTVSDGNGGTTSTTLTITIKGTDDAPVANPDYNSAKESTTSSGSGFVSTGYSATGTVAGSTGVLANDTDVDSSDTKTVAGISVSGSTTVGSVTVTAGTATMSFIGDTAGFNSVNTNGSAKLYVHLASDAANANYRAVYAADGITQIYVINKVESPSGSGNYLITLNANPAKYYDAAGLQSISKASDFFATNGSVGFENSSATTENASNMKTATVSVAQSNGYTTITGLSGITGTIASGMSVSGTGVPSGTTISQLNYTNGSLNSIRLNSELTSTTGGVFTFTGTSSLSQTIQGAHGSLVLNSDGSYTYTPTTDNQYLASGQSAVEVFDYTMKDSQNVTSSSKLYITVYGAGSADPVLVNDSGTAYEAGIGRAANNSLSNDNTAYSGTTASGSVIGNDTPGSSGVVASYSKVDGTGTVSAGSSLTGSYGQLSITSAGTYTYTINNSNSTVNALLPGQTLSETFLYKVTNTAGGSAWANLVITIQGTNDQPVAVADTDATTLKEDVTTTATGNVLTNDT